MSRFKSHLAESLHEAGERSLNNRIDLRRACRAAVAGDVQMLRVFACENTEVRSRPTVAELYAAAKELHDSD